MFALLPVGGARCLAGARVGVFRAARDHLRCRRPSASPAAHAAASALSTATTSSCSAPAAPAAACDLIVPAPQEALERALAGISADFPLNLESDWLAPEDAAMVTMVSSPWDCTMCNFEHTGRSIHRSPQHMHDYIRADLVDHVDFDLHEFGLGLPMRFGLRFDDSIEAETAKYNAEAAALFRPSRPTGDEPACRASDEDPPHAPLSEAALARMHALWRQQAGVLETRVGELLAEGRLVGVLGGDHMSSFGAMRAFGAHCAARGEGFGLLQFDAHADLYDTFEQLQCSHACIIKRVLEEVPALESVVAVGIREMGPDEVAAHAADPRHRIFSGADLRRATGGDNNGGDGAGRWGQAVRDIVSALPRHVWVTFDIDGLDLSFCPGTGTPVPGGLSYNQAVDVLLEIHRSGRVLCGWDLVEVGSGPAAVNVGARLANKLAGLQLLGVGARDPEPLQLRGVGGADGSAARE